MDNAGSEAGLRFIHRSEVAPKEFLAQLHGDRRAVVHGQVLEWNADRFVAYTRYDPGFIIARHAHKSDALIFILEGDVMIGDRNCPPGTLVVLEKDVFFGPLIAGPQGCTFLESYAGDDFSWRHRLRADSRAAFAAHLARANRISALRAQAALDTLAQAQTTTEMVQEPNLSLAAETADAEVSLPISL